MASNDMAIKILMSSGASMDIVATKGKFSGKSLKDLDPVTGVSVSLAPTQNGRLQLVGGPGERGTL